MMLKITRDVRKSFELQVRDTFLTYERIQEVSCALCLFRHEDQVVTLFHYEDDFHSRDSHEINQFVEDVDWRY